MTNPPIDRAAARATPARRPPRARAVGPGHRLDLRGPHDLPAAGDQHLPADLDGPARFTNYAANRPNDEVEWVGLRNYDRILTDDGIWANMQTTAHFLFWTIVLQVLIGFTLAWLINRKFKGNDLLTTLIVLPMMLSPAVVGNFWTFLYQPQIGLINYMVELVTGIPASSFSMLGPGGFAPWSIIIVDTWMWTPFVMLICLAGLRSIPDYIYEAAEVDRASKWRQFWTITVPMVLPFLMLAVLFRGIENFKMFDMVVLLTGGGPRQ